MLIIDPSFSTNYPAIVYLFGAFGLFVHQTLDEIDGKQARRIGAANSLGQLFDHGCDSFSVNYMTLLMASSQGLNVDHIFWTTNAFMSFIFYMMNWMEYHSHVSATRVGQLGVNEMHFLFMFFLIFNAVTGFGLAEISIFKGTTVGD